MLSDIFVTFQDMPDKKIGIALVYSGCKKGASGNPCPGCHNPWLWSFEPRNDPKEVRSRHLYHMENSEGLKAIDGIVILGGEPFDQNTDEVVSDIENFRSREPELKVVIYTGYETLEQAAGSWLLKNPFSSVWEHPLVQVADFIKIGPYMENIPPLKGSSLASGNQKMYAMTRKNGRVRGKREVFF